ncbi:MAG: PH domain-containing protein, partial [Actinomycetota bacterium]
MPFPRKLLAEHEKLVFDLRPHWIALAPPVMWTLVIGAAMIAAYSTVDSGAGENAIVITALVLWGWLSVLPFLRWRFTNFVLTTDRLITRSGIIAKQSKEIPLERINDVAFSQSVFERILGAGDLLIESAGERGQERISNVRKPEEVQLRIYKVAEENSNR